MKKYVIAEGFDRRHMSYMLDTMQTALKYCGLDIKSSDRNDTSGRLVVEFVGTKLGFCKFFTIRNLKSLKTDLKYVMGMKKEYKG